MAKDIRWASWFDGAKVKVRAAWVVGALLGSLALAGIGTAAEPSNLLTYDAKKQTVTVNLVSGQTQENKTFNFNGYAKGSLVITVPAGWTVEMIVDNVTAIPHSAVVTAWDQRKKPMGFTPAFANAAQANFETGTTSKDKAARFTFKADKPGRYALVCGVPGHSIGGMWAEFVVSDDVKVPSFKTGSPQE